MKPAPMLITTAGLALLAAACTGGPPSADPGGTPGAGGQASSSSAVGYSRCMRSHGVPDFPAPDGPERLPAPAPERHITPAAGPAVPDGRRLPAGPGAADADRRP